MKQLHVNFSLCFPRLLIWNRQKMHVYCQKMKNTKYMDNHFQQLNFLPETFSWNMTLVSLRKFLPIIKTSSPPLTEQLWSDFFRISGTPAGWAVNRAEINRLDEAHFYRFSPKQHRFYRRSKRRRLVWIYFHIDVKLLKSKSFLLWEDTIYCYLQSVSSSYGEVSSEFFFSVNSEEKTINT